MAEINDFNIVDASNTGRWPEGMAPSGVNDAGRADEGILARWHEDTNGSVASTGSANAYLFAAKQTLSAYYDGLTITFDANFTNTGAATLNVDSVSADAIVWPDQTVLANGDIISGSKVTVRHDGTSWQLVTSSKPQFELGNEVATTSGTEVDFTGVKAGTKRIVVMFAGVSTDGTAGIGVQLGDAGGFEATGYSGSEGVTASAAQAFTNLSTSFAFLSSWIAGTTIHGTVVLTLEDSANNTWVATGTLGNSGAANIYTMGGSKSLSAELTQVRITASGDNFDAGAVNVLIE